MNAAPPPQPPAYVQPHTCRKDPGPIPTGKVWFCDTFGNGRLEDAPATAYKYNTVEAPLPPLPADARKDPHAFCSAILFWQDTTNPGWRTLDVPFYGVTKNPVGVLVHGGDATIGCYQDGSFKIESETPSIAAAR